MDLKTLEKSYCWACVDDVYTIMEPIFKKLGITYFDYARFYPGGSSFSLCSNKAWLSTFITHLSYYTPTSFLPEGAHLWSHYIPKNIYSVGQESFDLVHGITLVKKLENYDEVLNFCAPKTHHAILDIYLNHRELLEQIGFYFKDRATHMIKKAENNCIILAEDKTSLFTDTTNIIHDVRNLLSQHNTKKKLTLHINNKQVVLTQRESQCLFYLLQGLSAKMIARQMNISYRTVELYCEKLRHKTGSPSTKLLVSMLNARDINIIQSSTHQF